MLPIGEFSKICSVTTKTLRYYDEIGLLKPIIVNEHNGYRFYDVKQLKAILFINKLKKYNFSLEEIDRILKDSSGEALPLLIRRKKQWFQDQLESQKFVLRQLDEDLEKLEKGIDIMAYLDTIAVDVVETLPKNILYSRQHMSTDDYCKYFGKLFETIAKNKLTCLGAPIAIYHDKEFNPANNDTEIAIPIAERTPETRELAGGLCAKGIHRGPYSELSSTYSRIVQWVEENGYQIAAPPYEVYVTDPATTPAPEDYITEIYFPIQK